jgi:hypothetical protein
MAHAGVWDSLTTYVKDAVKSGVIGQESEDHESEPELEPEPDAESESEPESESDPDVTTTTDEGMCRVPQQQPDTVCELGSGFLCVSTPDKGVAEDWAVIKGTIDRKNSVVTSVEVVAQHEYTKETHVVDTTDPLVQGCWESDLVDRPFCLDEEGYFAARIPLDELGPYTVSVSASRLAGANMSSVVRLSRVIAPDLSRKSISFVPDIVVEPQVSESVVSVEVDLLGDCQFCDFIGAATGGVTVKVENAIASEGNIRHISCETSVEQGGQGRFVIGVPVSAGQNSLTITVCNAAVEDSCPTIGGFTFEGGSRVGGIEIITPDPMPAYDASEYPHIDWSFRIDGMDDDCVNVQLNRQPIERVCASGGTFDVRLNPSPGINVVTAESYPWTFGWGAISSPFDESGYMSLDVGLTSERSVQLAFPAHTMTHVFQPILSNFLVSDAMGDFISSILGGAPPTRDPSTEDDDSVDEAELEKAEGIDAVKATLTECTGESGFMEGKRIEVVGKPKIGKAKLENMHFEQDAISFTINADDVEARIRLVTDEDLNGVPDKDPIPFLIAFRKAYIDIKLEQSTGSDGRDVFLISSPHTDCDYKSNRYCKHMPASLIPKYFLGAANRLHGFVSCDAEGQQVSDEIEGLCKSLNSLDAQTGLISEKVLDAVNGTLYCTGSSTMTYLLRGGAVGAPVRVGCFPDDPEDKLGALLGCTSGAMGQMLGPWKLSSGINLGDGLHITGEGVYATADLRVGRKQLFEEMDEQLKHPSVGVVVDPVALSADLPIGSAQTDRLIRLAMSTNALNHLLFLLTQQMADEEPTGLLDIDLSDPFFKSLGFDFVEQCDALNEGGGQVKQPSPLCNIRPRVGELLGSSLTTYKYFPQNHPLLMRLRGNRALTPHLKIASLDELPVVSRVEGEQSEASDVPTGNLLDLQLGGITLKFYALEVDDDAPLDEFGNLSLLLDDEGNPIIRSMRPEMSDLDGGQIISVELTLLLGLEIGDVSVHPDDPSSLMLTLRPLAERSRLVLTPVPGSNATTVPPEGLVSALREKLSYAISIFSAPEKAIKIPIPKRLSLAPATPSPDSLLGMLGLRTLSLGPDGLGLDFHEDSSFLTIDLGGVIQQVFLRDGQVFEEEY